MIQKIAISLFFFCVLVSSLAVKASETGGETAFRSTEYPLPRFVSLRSNEIYVRTGPGKQFPVQWIFRKKGLPVEIILEYDVWRKIKDYDGHEGWIHKSLLTGKRTGFLQVEEKKRLYKKPNKKSKVQAFFEPDVLLDVEKCRKQWCLVTASGYRGWLQQSMIWGVYEDEEFD